MRASRWRVALLVVGAIAALAIAIPVLGADPSPSASPPGHAKPDKSQNPGWQKKAERAAEKAKAPKTPELDVSVTGTVQQSTDGKGRPAFTLTADGKTWELSA